MRILGLFFKTSPTLLMLGLNILWLIKFFIIVVFVLGFQKRNHFRNLDKKKSAKNLYKEGGNGIYNNEKQWCSLMKQQLNMILLQHRRRCMCDLDVQEEFDA